MGSEKISVNVDDKELAKMDLLIENGLYRNRSDIVNQALERFLASEDENIRALTNRNQPVPDIWFLGVQTFDKNYLEQAKKRSIRFRIKGFGVMIVDPDVPASLAEETVERISPKIKIKASDEIAALLKAKQTR